MIITEKGNFSSLGIAVREYLLDITLPLPVEFTIESSVITCCTCIVYNRMSNFVGDVHGRVLIVVVKRNY